MSVRRLPPFTGVQASLLLAACALVNDCVSPHSPLQPIEPEIHGPLGGTWYADTLILCTVGSLLELGLFPNCQSPPDTNWEIEVYGRDRLVGATFGQSDSLTLFYRDVRLGDTTVTHHTFASLADSTSIEFAPDATPFVNSLLGATHPSSDGWSVEVLLDGAKATFSGSSFPRCYVAQYSSSSDTFCHDTVVYWRMELTRSHLQPLDYYQGAITSYHTLQNFTSPWLLPMDTTVPDCDVGADLSSSEWIRVGAQALATFGTLELYDLYGPCTGTSLKITADSLNGDPTVERWYYDSLEESLPLTAFCGPGYEPQDDSLRVERSMQAGADTLVVWMAAWEHCQSDPPIECRLFLREAYIQKE